ncbi:hypothetical protein BJY04DRAFT_231199 [Aspergillus karnatakaensis]|uniref:SGNH/GDSL hydrolase family protein n=1 Tax=Aspergillus karnatakaensis TaxID=1810916 RepID=UPI003CCDD8A7
MHGMIGIYFFSFDSYTWTGFNSSLEAPSIANPMGNPGLGEETATDGLNWLGYLVTTFNESSILSYNFASYGATVNNSAIPAFPPGPRDLVQQATDFREHYCDDHAGWDAETSLFGIWIGINDVYHSSTMADPSASIQADIQSYTELYHQLYDCGARRLLVMNVPQITRTPALLADHQSHRDAVYDSVLHFNFLLEREIALWNNNHTPDASSPTHIFFFNAWAFTDYVLDNPIAFGFRDSSCIGEGCIWWDDFHPTSQFHRLLAAELQSTLHI